MYVYSQQDDSLLGVLQNLAEFEREGEPAGFKSRADVDFEANPGLFDEVQEDWHQFTVESEVLKKNGSPVTLNSDGDQTAIERYMANLPQAQIDGMKAGAKAHMQGLTAQSSDADKAIGWIMYNVFRGD